MKPTHQLVTGEFTATAWQFNRESPIPVWVAKKFHQVEQTGWQCVSPKGELVTAYPTNWAVMTDEKTMTVLTDEEFQLLFKPIPLA